MDDGIDDILGEDNGGFLKGEGSESGLEMTPQESPTKGSGKLLNTAASQISLALPPAERKRLSHSHPAVLIDSAYKSYGKFPVLQNLNMTIRENTIYGLLGSSGCGKTTALSCIVGLMELNAGQIYIYGETPGTPESGVPGKRVGYMPQEIALNSEFTIKEVLQYFGRIYGMTVGEVEVRRKYLVELLRLETCKGPLRDMSGGQKRRVSFAVALIHEPELLILDEPTVGVDPLLRQSIWQHLCDLVAQKRTTVIITTHYIEETRQADTIGLMRNGRLMVEDSPANLLETYNCTLLEDIVLKLCLRDEKTVHAAEEAPMEQKPNNAMKGITFPNTVSPASIEEKGDGVVGLKFRRSSVASKPPDAIFNSTSSGVERSQPKDDYSTKMVDRIKALCIKNFLVMFRSIGFLLFLFVVPSSQIIMVCLCLGSDPKHLNFGVVNHEVPTWGDCWYEDDLCIVANLSCRYVGALGSRTVTLLPYESEELALQGIIDGNLWGYLSIPENFTDNMVDRVSGGKKAILNETIIGSQIRFKMDMSNTQVGLSLQKLFYDGFRTFVSKFLGACGEHVEGRDIPLVFEEPVYGHSGVSVTDFITPGIATAFLSFMSSLTCGLAFIVEKKDGMLHRAMVAGVLKVEIMVAHSATHFLVLVVQTSIAFMVMFLVFDIPQLGSLPLAYALVLLNGVAGMALGFVAATVCNEEKNAMLLAIGAILPCFLVSGTIFPFEALPVPIQYVGYLVPGTLPGDALRSILLRGWGITHYSVWIGFVSAAAWTAIYWIITFTYHKLHK